MERIHRSIERFMDYGVQDFIQSALFSRTFREGMELVEETANYLDGEGRTLSKEMERNAAMAYAGSSMRLTTQLMQIASWLLVIRALREGDMTLGEARDEKYRIHPKNQGNNRRGSHGELPEHLQGLIIQSDSLYERIARLDKSLFGEEAVEEMQGAAAQQRALMDAFGRK